MKWRRVVRRSRGSAARTGGEVTDRPHREEIDLDINEALIVAFYTR
ncbi:MAG: hypothetical protein MPW15_19990 [Candidatus Manganitrophus sp.]|nr:hypothetical protein [Candidatus Manganitrophus sp.]